jgi:putative ABC transport system ATP-binding protein
VAVVGKSSGKSTLLNLLGGIRSATSQGSIEVGISPRFRAWARTRLAIWRGHHVGLVFQFFQLRRRCVAGT